MSDTVDSCTPRSTCRCLHALGYWLVVTCPAGLRCPCRPAQLLKHQRTRPPSITNKHRATLKRHWPQRPDYRHRTCTRRLPSSHPSIPRSTPSSRHPTRQPESPTTPSTPSTSKPLPRRPLPHRIYLVSVHHDERVWFPRSARWPAGWRAAWIATSAARVVRRAGSICLARRAFASEPETAHAARWLRASCFVWGPAASRPGPAEAAHGVYF